MNQPRKATYTTPAADEIHLRYLQEGVTLHGKPADAFYSEPAYTERQALHGKTTYPDPTHG